MLADALRPRAAHPRGARVVDVGTGAGAPGLALALLRPDLRVTLVEPLGKRAAFLRTVLGAVGPRRRRSSSAPAARPSPDARRGTSRSRARPSRPRPGSTWA